MNKNLKPINEEERNINWEEVEHKVKIICNKFNNIDARHKDDLAQELRIHAYYVSDDYYDLQRKAIDFWRTLSVKIMPEVPYLDLELVGGVLSEKYEDIYFSQMVNEIQEELTILDKDNEETQHLKNLAKEILDILVFDITGAPPKKDFRENTKYKPYHNKRISCSYLWEVLGDHVGFYDYKKIRKSLKMIGDICIKLDTEGRIDIDTYYKE